MKGEKSKSQAKQNERQQIDIIYLHIVEPLKK